MTTSIFRNRKLVYNGEYIAIIRQKDKLTIKDFRTFKAARTWLDRETRKRQLKDGF